MDWLKANAFFAGMSLTAAVLLIAGFAIAHLLGLDPAKERVFIGAWCVFVLVADFLLFRWIWRRLDRRR